MPALLVVVAVVGVVRYHTLGQSSWRGVSMGMFATYDNETSRVVEVTVENAGGATRVSLPPDLADDRDRLKVVPTDGAARRLATAVLASAQPAGATRASVTVWRLHLDDRGGDLVATRRRLAHAEAVAER